MSRKKILIIKTGFSEFLDRGISTTVSLGDVLFCTSLLYRYKNDRVTWLTSHKGSPLLKDNPYIDELLTFGPSSLQRVTQGSYDVLINLEKDIGICASLNRIKAKKKFGFYFDEKRYDIACYNNSTRYLLSGQENHANIKKTAGEILFETVGEKWHGEVGILHRKKPAREKYDIGFNFAVGPKWPTKGWPMDNWKALEGLLKDQFSISWQKGHKDIEAYINWIESCRLIVSSDSLGHILGQALGKNVIVLFGPTNYVRMKGMPSTYVIPSTLKCPYMPCYLPICKHDKFCMDYISPEKVALECRKVLSEVLSQN